MSCIVAIDTAHNACSVGIRLHDGVTFVQSKDMKRGQSEALMPMIEGVFKQAHCTPRDVEAYFVNSGPGRFTGIRLGLAAAKGLALPYDKMVVGLTSSEIFAFDSFKDKNYEGSVAVVVNSGRGNVFFQLWEEPSKPRADIEDMPPEKAANIINASQADVLVVGDGQSLIKPYVEGKERVWDKEKTGVSPEAMLEIGQQKIFQGMYNPVARPFYGRAPDVTIAKS